MAEFQIQSHWAWLPAYTARVAGITKPLAPAKDRIPGALAPCSTGLKAQEAGYERAKWTRQYLMIAAAVACGMSASDRTKVFPP